MPINSHRTASIAKVILACGFLLYSSVMLRVVNSSFPADLDAARYLMLAQNLLTGQGYVDNYKPLASAHTKFPPVLPCTLALAMWIVPNSLVAMKLTIAGFGLLALVATYLVLSRLIAPLPASIITIVISCQVAFLSYSQRLMSETPYLFFSMLTILLVLRRFDSNEAKAWQDVGIGFVMSLAIMTRAIGLVLLPALLASALLRRGLHKKWRLALIVSLMVLATEAGWMVRNTVATHRFLPIYGTFLIFRDRNHPEAGLARPTDIFHRASHNIGFYRNNVIPAALSNLARVPLLPTFFITFMLVGWLARLVRYRGTLEFYVLFYVLLLLAWPWCFDRFLLPVAPILLFYFVHGVTLATQGVWAVLPRLPWGSMSGRRARGRARAPTGLLSAVSIVLGSLMLLASVPVPITLLCSDYARQRFNRYPPKFSELFNAARWIAGHTPASAVILTTQAAPCYMISKRKSFGPRDVLSTKMYRTAAQKGNLFVIQRTSPSDVAASRRIAAELLRTKGHWHVVFKTGSTYVIAQNTGDGRAGR